MSPLNMCLKDFRTCTHTHISQNSFSNQREEQAGFYRQLHYFRSCKVSHELFQRHSEALPLYVDSGVNWLPYGFCLRIMVCCRGFLELRNDKALHWHFELNLCDGCLTTPQQKHLLPCAPGELGAIPYIYFILFKICDFFRLFFKKTTTHTFHKIEYNKCYQMWQKMGRSHPNPLKNPWIKANEQPK